MRSHSISSYNRIFPPITTRRVGSKTSRININSNRGISYKRLYNTLKSINFSHTNNIINTNPISIRNTRSTRSRNYSISSLSNISNSRSTYFIKQTRIMSSSISRTFEILIQNIIKTSIYYDILNLISPFDITIYAYTFNIIDIFKHSTHSIITISNYISRIINRIFYIFRHIVITYLSLFNRTLLPLGDNSDAIIANCLFIKFILPDNCKSASTENEVAPELLVESEESNMISLK